jgi:hypothetical protein
MNLSWNIAGRVIITDTLLRSDYICYSRLRYRVKALCRGPRDGALLHQTAVRLRLPSRDLHAPVSVSGGFHSPHRLTVSD